jgi:hypothetical protein
LSNNSDVLDSIPQKDHVEQKVLMVVFHDIICILIAVAGVMLNNSINLSKNFRLLKKEDTLDLCMRLKMGSMHTKQILVFVKWMHQAPTQSGMHGRECNVANCVLTVETEWDRPYVSSDKQM